MLFFLGNMVTIDFHLRISCFLMISRPLRDTKFHSDISQESSLFRDNSNFKLKHKVILLWGNSEPKFTVLQFLAGWVDSLIRTLYWRFFSSLWRKRMEKYFWNQDWWKGHCCASLALQFCWVKMFFCRQQYWTCPDIVWSHFKWH